MNTNINEEEGGWRLWFFRYGFVSWNLYRGRDGDFPETKQWSIGFLVPLSYSVDETCVDNRLYILFKNRFIQLIIL